MLDAATYPEPDPNTGMDPGMDAGPPEAATASPGSDHDDFVRTVFGTDPTSYATASTEAAAAEPPPAPDDAPSSDQPSTEGPDDGPDNGPEFLPTGKLFQPGGDDTPGPGLDPETGGPLDPPAATDPSPGPADPDMDPETGEPWPDAPKPDGDGGEYEPRDEPPAPTSGRADPDMDPETGEPWPDAPNAGDPDANGTERGPDADPEANVGRGAGPNEAPVPYEPTPAAGERILLGTPQREQAAEQLAKLPPAEHDKVMALLETAANHSPEESEYMVKALAAGHTVAELQEFQKTISGKDQAWMDANLRLVGGSAGKGIKQQWSHSCASTEVEAMKGELDPIYAFQLRQKNPKLDQADDKDGMGINPNMGQEQIRLMVETGGIAVPRNDAEHGRGGKMSTVLNSEAAGMGLTFDRNDIGKDVTMDEALATAQQKLKSGIPVPICVGDDANPFAHAAMMTAVEDGPPRRFYIHDPWTGSVKAYSEADIKDGKLDVGSCKKLAVIYPAKRK